MSISPPTDRKPLQFQKKDYDIIFMDVNMPVKDGVEALWDIA
jgi:CheY-like chemotaxis protein